MSIEICVFTEPQQGQTYGDQLALAQAAELHGFDGFFRSDHYMAFGGASGLPDQKGFQVGSLVNLR